MGSREKAKRFLEASETPQIYSSIIEFALTFYQAKAEKEGNKSFAEELKRTRESYMEDFSSALEITEEVYCEEFDDEELNDLTVIHTTPASRKLREHMPGIMKKILEKYSLQPS